MSMNSSKTNFIKATQDLDDPADKLPKGWKESDFVVFKEFYGFCRDKEPDLFVFEYRMINHLHPQLPNYTLNEDGILTSEIYIDIDSVKTRISIIMDSGGIPDESVKALEAYHRAEVDYDANPPVWAPFPSELTS
ncbi:MAG: hypothetical protein CBB87_10475 [Micavibrio sp. TMED27]|nr:hypothetical protein [Micavibrio sp.]OUT90178.1 MAG: hypothetical protein CBB87_10475 [Micavibrio sp. TMED27]